MTEPAMDEVDLRASGERIDALLDAMAASGPMARERAEELLRLVTELYGAGLERLLSIAHERGALEAPMLDAIASDELVSSLLLVHGLHPYDLETRVARALDDVRPYLGSHGGDVEVVDISDEGVVRLRMLGSCDGCPSSSVTLTTAVDGAIRAAAPEVIDIQVEEAAPAATKSGGVISIDSLRVRTSASEPRVSEPRWTAVPSLAELQPGQVAGCLVAGMAIVGCRVGSDLFAFRDSCAACSASLSDASLARLLGAAAGDVVLRCASCRARYEVRKAGAGMEGGHLDPIPLLVRDDVVEVAIPASVA